MQAQGSSSTVDGDVLAALALADAAFTGRGLHRVIGRHSADGVRRAVERLARQGVVDVALAGPSKLYSLAADLATLLRKKTASGYSDRGSSDADCKQAKRAMERLVEAADALSIGNRESRE